MEEHLSGDSAHKRDRWPQGGKNQSLTVVGYGMKEARGLKTRPGVDFCKAC